MKHSVFFAVLFAVNGFVNVFSAEPDWNQWRGPNHDNHSFTTGIAKQWGENGPKLLWKINTLGGGFSNISFSGDRFYTLGDTEGKCRLMAFNKADGKQLWSTVIGAPGAPGGYPGPKSTPAVDDQYVYAFGQFGDFVCADKETGKEIWGGNVAKELGGKPQNLWGYSSSPILDNGHIVLPVGGNKGTLVAFEKDGRRAWRSAELKDDAPYSSAVPADIGGKKQYLLFTLSGLYGVDSDNGSVLWGVDRYKDKPVCSDPVYKDGVAFVSSHYEMGAHGYSVEKQGAKFTAQQIYKDASLPNHHGGVVLVGDHIYFTNQRELVCLKLSTGEIAWKNRSVGKGSITVVDGYLIVRSESGDGEIALVEANPQKYAEKGRFAQPDRTDKNSWTYPVITDGKLYIRDQGTLLVYDLK